VRPIQAGRPHWSIFVVTLSKVAAMLMFASP
jgi:hypothetical protein